MAMAGMPVTPLQGMNRGLLPAMALAIAVATVIIQACASPEPEPGRSVPVPADRPSQPDAVATERIASPAAEVSGATALATPSPPTATTTLRRENVESVPILASGGAGALAAGVSAPMTDTARQSRMAWRIDPDDASYALVRWHLDRRSLPPPEAIRIAGLANAFDDPDPSPPAYTLGLTAGVFPSPTRPGFHILSLVLRAAGDRGSDHGAVFVAVVETAAASVPRVRQALRLLTGALDDRDLLGIVAHGPRGRMILEPARVASGRGIDRAIDALREGKPDLVAGLQLGYGMADREPGRPGRILLFSDGTGIRSAGETLFDDLRRQARAGLTLSVIGFPNEGYDPRLMARLARHGGGRHAVADNPAAARRLFSRLPGSLAVVARDVGGLIEFSPETVSRFRMLGDPREPAAGDSGAGRPIAATGRATALVELQLTGRSGPLGAVRVRYRPAEGDDVKQLEVALAPPKPDPSNRLTGRYPPELRSWIAATFGEKLGGSYWTRDVSYGRLLRSFRALDAAVRTDPQTAELRYLIQQARRLEPRRTVRQGADTGPPERRVDDIFDQLRVIE